MDRWAETATQMASLFRFLAAGQRSVVADLDDTAGHDRVLELLAESDIVVSSSSAGRNWMPGGSASPMSTR